MQAGMACVTLACAMPPLPDAAAIARPNMAPSQCDTFAARGEQASKGHAAMNQDAQSCRIEPGYGSGRRHNVLSPRPDMSQPGLARYHARPMGPTPSQSSQTPATIG